MSWFNVVLSLFAFARKHELDTHTHTDMYHIIISIINSAYFPQTSIQNCWEDITRHPPNIHSKTPNTPQGTIYLIMFECLGFFSLLTSHFRCLNHCFLQWRSLVSEPTFVHLFFAIPCLLGWLSISGRLGVWRWRKVREVFQDIRWIYPQPSNTIGVHGGSDRN